MGGCGSGPGVGFGRGGETGGMDGGSPIGGSGFSTILSLEIEELGIPASMRPRGRAFSSAGDFRFRLATVKQRLESSCPGK
jgi:hypothetical protein